MTPYTSPVDWANANSRVLGVMAEQQGNMMQAQAHQAQLAQRASQSAQESTDRQADFELRRPQLLQTRDRDQADAIKSFFNDTADLGDEEFNARLVELQARGINTERLRDDPPTRLPLEPSPYLSAPAPVAPPAAKPAPAPAVPPPAAPPAKK